MVHERARPLSTKAATATGTAGAQSQGAVKGTISRGLPVSPREIIEYANLLLCICLAFRQGWTVLYWADQRFTRAFTTA